MKRFKELAHMIVEAEQSQGLQWTSWDSSWWKFQSKGQQAQNPKRACISIQDQRQEMPSALPQAVRSGISSYSALQWGDEVHLH